MVQTIKYIHERGQNGSMNTVRDRATELLVDMLLVDCGLDLI